MYIMNGSLTSGAWGNYSPQAEQTDLVNEKNVQYIHLLSVYEWERYVVLTAHTVHITSKQY